MFTIQLEKLEELPVIEFSQTKGVEDICKECKERFTMYLHIMGKRRWMMGECKNCDTKYVLTPKQCDYIQPSSRLFKLYYGRNPIKEELKKERDFNKRKEILKGERDERVKRSKILKPWEKADVKYYIKEHNLE
jgi:hypothetical protein|tara:strand:+ start:3015 stop:3416 length:402 start_codon:yes stop_codon:yes gene_type:complete